MPDNILISLLHNDHYVSGQIISSRLGITRAAVWKKISSLRKKGYSIKAVPSKGYRLISAPELDRDFLLTHVGGGLWKEIIVHDSVESTNNLALSLSAEGSLASGTALIADLQTGGKGRLGRRWISPAGMNIYMSLIIQPDLEPKELTMLTVLAGVSSVTALSKICSIPISIKWPNDLMISDKKLGGILTEVRADSDGISVAVIGIGININMCSKNFPEEIKDLATSIRVAAGISYSRNEIICQILRDFEQWYDILKKEGRGKLLDAWRKYSSTLGRTVMATVGQTSVSGIAEDINDSGMLLLRTPSGQQVTISAGDITLLR